MHLDLGVSGAVDDGSRFPTGERWWQRRRREKRSWILSVRREQQLDHLIIKVAYLNLLSYSFILHKAIETHTQVAV